tara:strand:- start:49 stop:480 length:432 start_codon:yes stop_codon:yes gene_type:complete
MLNKIINNEFECQKLGEEIALLLKPGDIISLEGDLGVGKTTMVKGILKKLNYRHDVTSPTFTLVNEYNADYKVIHIDCYRENDLERWKQIGLDEYLYSDNIVIIEWGNLIRKLLPEDCIVIKLEHMKEEQKRKIYSDYEYFSN